MLLIRDTSVQILVGWVLWGPKQDAWLHNEPHGWLLGPGSGTGADNKNATSTSDAQMMVGMWASSSSTEKTNTRQEKWRQVEDKEGHLSSRSNSDGELPNSGHPLASQIQKQLMFPQPFPYAEPLTHITQALSSASVFTGGVRGQRQHHSRGQ